MVRLRWLFFPDLCAHHDYLGLGEKKKDPRVMFCMGGVVRISASFFLAYHDYGGVMDGHFECIIIVYIHYIHITSRSLPGFLGEKGMYQMVIDCGSNGYGRQR